MLLFCVTSLCCQADRDYCPAVCLCSKIQYMAVWLFNYYGYELLKHWKNYVTGLVKKKYIPLSYIWPVYKRWFLTTHMSHFLLCIFTHFCSISPILYHHFFHHCVHIFSCHSLLSVFIIFLQCFFFSVWQKYNTCLRSMVFVYIRPSMYTCVCK